MPTTSSARQMREQKARCQFGLASSAKWKADMESPQDYHPYADMARNLDVPSGPDRVARAGVREVPRDQLPHYSQRELVRQRKNHTTGRRGHLWEEQPAGDKDADGLFVSAAAMRALKMQPGGHAKRQRTPPPSRRQSEDGPAATSWRRLQTEKRTHQSTIVNPAAVARARSAGPAGGRVGGGQTAAAGRLVTL
eukprot:TRINITY_DN5164_c0_g1_i1.p2 TRINITY_DN5164_c0_g1~~TRINITY_DN5164_c0_g1_i1.p2  ORF type:complete len:194 (+),score=42.34 TRINITY_DN5164_c0_g1_i1:150-731(+)